MWPMSDRNTSQIIRQKGWFSNNHRVVRIITYGSYGSDSNWKYWWIEIHISQHWWLLTANMGKISLEKSPTPLKFSLIYGLYLFLIKEENLVVQLECVQTMGLSFKILILIPFALKMESNMSFLHLKHHNRMGLLRGKPCCLGNSTGHAS